ncbi:lipopolysaccharide kinase InaA family protein [Parabacteroides sp. FAFU027]|uniref:lipopolysaccharide kinase InaA family protein n=1 Tax=Parabacteroides sp. FAFU027 TaxID=2922715 RepID=UPI001FAEAE92|nr:lipopolysaccharide kinase InaA family protein [Parabacteroides sp. FAFU027]
MFLEINPDYQFLKDFVLSLPQTFGTEGTVLYKVRNEVRLIEVAGIKVVVKKFKVPHLINRFAYSYIRKSKARRSYEYAMMLKQNGFGTADPIACMEFKQGGLLADSYLITLHCPYSRDFNEFRETPLNGRENILCDFAQFTARLHEKGIRHLDYGGGNIMFEQTDNGTEFCLIDINRMAFGKVGIEKGCENFKLLYMLDDSFHFLAEEYAKARGFDTEKCFELIKPHIRKNG